MSNRDSVSKDLFTEHSPNCEPRSHEFVSDRLIKVVAAIVQDCCTEPEKYLERSCVQQDGE